MKLAVYHLGVAGVFAFVSGSVPRCPAITLLPSGTHVRHEAFALRSTWWRNGPAVERPSLEPTLPKPDVPFSAYSPEMVHRLIDNTPVHLESIQTTFLTILSSLGSPGPSESIFVRIDGGELEIVPWDWNDSGRQFIDHLPGMRTPHDQAFLLYWRQNLSSARIPYGLLFGASAGDIGFLDLIPLSHKPSDFFKRYPHSRTLATRACQTVAMGFAPIQHFGIRRVEVTWAYHESVEAWADATHFDGFFEMIGVIPATSDPTYERPIYMTRDLPFFSPMHANSVDFQRALWQQHAQIRGKVVEVGTGIGINALWSAKLGATEYLGSEPDYDEYLMALWTIAYAKETEQIPDIPMTVVHQSGIPGRGNYYLYNAGGVVNYYANGLFDFISIDVYRELTQALSDILEKGQQALWRVALNRPLVGQIPELRSMTVVDHSYVLEAAQRWASWFGLRFDPTDQETIGILSRDVNASA